MKKTDIFKDTPKGFHNCINETLNGLENTKVIRYSFKKYAIVCAAVLVMVPILCVGAGKLFQWYQVAQERFDTEKELEDKLTAEGAVLPGTDADLEKGVKINALQSVKKNNGYYLLAGFKWPEKLEWNEDIAIEKSRIVSQNETIDCTANFAATPDENGTMYIEVDVNGSQITQNGGEIKLVLENIVQTDKAAIANTLVEAVWELSFGLPTSTEVISYETSHKLLVNDHELEIDRIEIGSFGVKIYTKKEEAMHATYYSPIWLSEVLYKDGTMAKQIETPISKLAAENKDGSFCFNIPLENIVDIDKVSALVFTEGNSTITLPLGETLPVETKGESKKDNKVSTLEELSGISDINAFQTIFERYDYVILTDDTNVYLWDKKCDKAQIIMSLTDYGYNKDKGAGIIAQQGTGGKTVIMKPYGNSEKVYLWKFGFEDIIEGKTEVLWPIEE